MIMYITNTECVCRIKLHIARMSEWSKEPDLRPGSVSCVGSNPTSCKHVMESQ